MTLRLAWYCFLGVFLFSSCATQKQMAQESKEAESALRSIAGALTDQQLTEKDMKELEKQIRHDPEARDAIEVLTNSLGSQGTVIKYCPVTGERYSSTLMKCPMHHVELMILED